MVGDTHITKEQLDQLVTFQVNSAKVAKQKIPAAGTAAYKTQLVDPILQRMITNAQVENIAKELGVTVSDSEVNAGLQKAIQAQFGTDTAKYQAYLKKYAITEDYLKQQLIRPQLLQTKIIAKLKSAVQGHRRPGAGLLQRPQVAVRHGRHPQGALHPDQEPGRCECRAQGADPGLELPGRGQEVLAATPPATPAAR